MKQTKTMPKRLLSIMLTLFILFAYLPVDGLRPMKSFAANPSASELEYSISSFNPPLIMTVSDLALRGKQLKLL